MNSFNRHKGVTLIEVLVGFVIFTSTLVAVLNYVSGEVYHNRLSATNLQKIQIIHDWSTSRQAGIDPSYAQSMQALDYSLLVTSSTADSVLQRDTEILLNHNSYSVGDAGNVFSWTLLRVE